MKNQNYRKTVEAMVKVIIPSVLNDDPQVSFHQAIDTSINLAKYTVNKINNLKQPDPDQVKMVFQEPGPIKDLKQSGEDMIEALENMKMERHNLVYKESPEESSITKLDTNDQIEGYVKFNEETKKFEHRDDDGDLIELNDQGIFQKVKDTATGKPWIEEFTEHSEDQMNKIDTVFKGMKKTAEEVDPGQAKRDLKESINRGKSVYDELNSKIKAYQKRGVSINAIGISEDSFKALTIYTTEKCLDGPDIMEKSKAMYYHGTRLIRTIDIAPGVVKIF